MKSIITSLIYFFSSFTFIYMIHVIFINRKRKQYSKGKGQPEINYIVKKFALDFEKTSYKTVKNWVSLINSFIMAFTFTIIINIEMRYVFKLLVSFVVLMILIYSLYEILGRVLKNKEKAKTKEAK